MYVSFSFSVYLFIDIYSCHFQLKKIWPKCSYFQISEKKKKKKKLVTQKDFVTKLCNDFIQRSTDQSASEIHSAEADLQAGKHMLPCSCLELVTTSFWHQAVSF